MTALGEMESGRAFHPFRRLIRSAGSPSVADFGERGPQIITKLTRLGVVQVCVTIVMLLGVSALDAATAGARSAPAANVHQVPRIIPSHERLAAGVKPAIPQFGARPHVREFPGMGPCEGGFCWTPGEPVIAVGLTDIVETVNTAATVYDKSTGNLLAEFDFGTFWGSSTSYCVDPRALYLSSVNRFAISCTDITSGTSPMRFAISMTSDPTGGWYKYSAPNTSFLDQDKIVATTDKFIIAGNTSSTEAIYVYNLSDVIGGTSSPQVVSLSAKKSNVYEAAVEQTPASTAYFVSSYPGGALYLAKITGTPSAGNVKLKETLVSATDYASPHEPSVPGGNIGGGDLDGRIYDAVYEVDTSDGKPIIQYSSARECGTRDCITSARIDLSGSTPVLSYDDLVGEPGWDYTYGAVGLDAAGDVFEAYSRSSSSSDPAAAVVGPGFDVTLQLPTSGTTSCSSGQSPPCDERWGDYLGTAIDPGDPSDVWVTGFYQSSNGGYGWGTVIAEVSTTSFPLPSVSTGPASGRTSSSATVTATINPNGVSTTYHIDYGTTTGYESATTETSAGSGTTAVPVSVPLGGLAPGTLYHYRVVATTSVGSAVGADETFRTKKPKITSVTFIGPRSNPTVTITGANFATMPAANPPTPLTCVQGDTSYDYGTSLYFTDNTLGWGAGESGDCIGLVVTSYTSTRIVYQFGADYSNYGPVTAGNSFTLDVYGKSYTGTVTYS